jgi:magnesium transporter
MTEEQEQRTSEPWIEIAELTEGEHAEHLDALIDELSAGDTARAFANLDEDLRRRTLETLPPERAGQVIDSLPESQAADLVELLPETSAAAILGGLPADRQADVLSHVDETHAENILDAMEPGDALVTRRLAAYPPDCAGGLMVAEYLHYPTEARVSDVIDDMRENAERYASYDVQYAYATTPDGALAGVVPMRDFLLADARLPIHSLMIEKPLRVSVDDSLDVLRDVFEQHPFVGLPVVAEGDQLVGVLKAEDVHEALEERSGSDHLKSQGIVGGEELRTMPLLERSGRRLSWLSVNIVLNIVAASVIAAFQETVEAVIALAVFLPIISDMSGCSGNQAVAVSLRELTLGLIRPIDAVRVWLKEISVGLLNGLALGALLATAAWLWKGNAYLGIVVGVALMLNTMVAVSIGGVIPLVLKRLRVDPALASGPVLTTVTDMCGFALVLGIATWMLPRLQGV